VVSDLLGKSTTKKRRNRRKTRKTFVLFVSSWLIFIVSGRRPRRQGQLLSKCPAGFARCLPHPRTAPATRTGSKRASLLCRRILSPLLRRPQVGPGLSKPGEVPSRLFPALLEPTMPSTDCGAQAWRRRRGLWMTQASYAMTWPQVKRCFEAQRNRRALQVRRRRASSGPAERSNQ